MKNYMITFTLFIIAIIPVYASYHLEQELSYTYTQTRQILHYDVFRPASQVSTSLAIILLHGGGYQSWMGEKETIGDLAAQFALRGYTVYNINYLIDEWTPFWKDAGVQSVYAVHDFIRQVIKPAGIHQVVLAGYSAGAITALSTAYMNDTDLEQWSLEAYPDYLSAAAENVKITGVIAFQGGIVDTSVITSEDRPRHTLLIGSMEDPIIAPDQGVPFGEVGNWYNETLEWVHNGITLMEKHYGLDALPHTQKTDTIIDQVHQALQLPKLYGSRSIVARMQHVGLAPEMIVIHQDYHEVDWATLPWDQIENWLSDRNSQNTWEAFISKARDTGAAIWIPLTLVLIMIWIIIKRK